MVYGCIKYVLDMREAPSRGVHYSYIDQTGMCGHLHADTCQSELCNYLLDGFLLMHGYYIRYCTHRYM